ncbi:ComF family protein [Anaeromyxobacter paludicola]|uniref:Amidophosphoribosyltransferase n=1 Tax=Anaeromyxobacter paludicola TaxID=2918171 RepID=A0ABN6NAP6_9BACT|nr:ComF family protein [Anaeromyxobacter paludicola]BDG09496.1 amidophosphoribosyltransferase [Anaeromyxobacter paludicola]
MNPALASPRPRGPLAAFGTALLDLLYPPRCAACGDGVPTSAAPFCAVCAGAIDPAPPGCPRCGQPGPAEPCGACLLHPPAFLEVRAGALFGGPLADAVHRLKYRDRPALARPLGRWLAGRLALPPGAVLVSVPLGRERRLARGYDQAALLAAALARAAGDGARRLPGALRRTRETPPQVGRGRPERSRNVAGAFEAAPAVRGQDLFLVDDVVTTGATADACARALLAAGARSVRVVALARAE